MIKLPEKIRGFRSRAINEIIDYLRSTTPLNSTTIRHEWRDGGIYSHAKNGYNTDEEVHFRVEQAGPTSVRVRGGKWSRRCCDNHNTQSLTVDSGTSGEYDDYKTLTGITASGYIVIKINNLIAETSLEAFYSATYPATDYNVLQRCVAIVTCTAGVITNIEQTFSGDVDDFVVRTDDSVGGVQKSLESSSSNAFWQIYNMDKAATAPSEGSDICMRTAVGGETFFSAMPDFVTYIESSINVNTQINAWINDNMGSWLDANMEDWLGDNHAHSNHNDFSTDDHNGADGKIGYWLVGGGETRNYGSAIGKSDQSKIIDLDSGELMPTVSGVWTCDCDFCLSGEAVKYKVNSDEGQTITDWITGGILTGATVVEKYVKVVDAATEETISVKILCIP